MDWITSIFDGSAIAGGVFLIIGIAGALLLLLSLILDGIFDAFDFGDGPLSLTTIAAFTTIFGFTSFACVGSGVPTTIAGLLGAVAGVIGGAIAWWLTRVIRSAESTTAVSSQELTGGEAVVVLGIPAGAGLGEVSLVRNGERISLSASSDEELPTGRRVRILDTLSPTSVRVGSLPAPDAAPQSAPAPAAGEPTPPAAH